MSRAPVTEDEVCSAADRLVRTGRKPTVDAVRAELGHRGSMTTLTRHLQAWWERLSGRIEAFDARPDVPAEIANNLTALWDAALSAARHALRHETDAAQHAAAAAVAAAEARASAAEHAAEIASANLATANVTIADLEARLERMQNAHDALGRRLAALQGEASALRDERSRLLSDLAAMGKAVQDASSATAAAIADLRNVQVSMEDRARLQLDAQRTQSAALASDLRKEITQLQDSLRDRDDRLIESARTIAALRALCARTATPERPAQRRGPTPRRRKR